MSHKIKIGDLRCEYRVNPIGIDIITPKFSWIIESEERNILQSAYQIKVSKKQDDFENLVWDSGKVQSDQSIHVKYDGEALKSHMRYYYKVQIWDQQGYPSEWSKPYFWEMGILDATEWKAQWITGDFEDDLLSSEVCPLLRKDFQLKGKIKSARIYATALGLYEMYLNGVRVGDALFTPGWTAYHKRLQYQTYDVTELLNDGGNVIGVILGNGWYKGYLGFEGKKNIYGDKLALLFEAHILYDDGREKVIISDDQWKADHSPILMSEIYHGEVYDARLEKVDWNMPGYDASAWAGTTSIKQSKDILVAQEVVPVKIIEEINPIALLQTPKGETVIDFGQNLVGWVQFTVQGARGSQVCIMHAEVLDKEGNFYIENLKKARQTVQYILKGEGKENFKPHFSYQGFRYIKLVEYPGQPKLEDFVAKVIHSDMERTGTFVCSDNAINQLQRNIYWGQKGNFLDVPTDCPQRDERLGWTADIQVFSRTACFNMNTALFLKKWLADLKAEQFENGAVPLVIPNVVASFFGQYSAAGWGDAAVICPWTVYLCYGDIQVLEDQYESMKAYVEYIRSVAEGGLLWNTGFQFGDWLALDGMEGSFEGATATDLIATIYFAYSTSILVKTAKLLLKEEDEKRYSELYEKIRAAFQQEFLSPTGRLVSPTQTAHVLSLMFNMVKEKDGKRIFNTLIKLLDNKKWHLDTGFLGTPYLCHVLSQNGRADVAYKLLFQQDYPSWLYQITKGATTIWEHWDGIKPDGTLYNPQMNSFNHYAYGAIGDWLYRVVAGIDLDESKPGYKHIVIKPQLCKELQWAVGEFKSMYGLIKARWSIESGLLYIDVVIPHNTTATITLPYAKIAQLSENAIGIRNREFYYDMDEQEGEVTLELGSGSYNFSYPFDSSLLPDLPVAKKMPWEH